MKVGGKEADCYIVSFPISFSVGSLEAEGGSEGLWIDKARFIVWRDELLGPRTADPLDTHGGVTSATLKWMDTSPAPACTFEFTPPRGAKRVTSFAGEEFEHPWSDVGASDAPGNVATGFSLYLGLIGKRPPDFALQDLGGRQMRLSDLRGKIVVLDFWASWCKPCLEELAVDQKLHDELASRGVVFLGIDDESPKTVRAFVRTKGYTFPMLLDTSQTAHQLYHVLWAPTTDVISPEGDLADYYIGAGGEAQLLRALKAAGLDKQAASK